MKLKVLILVLVTTIFASSAKTKVSIGLRAGINLQNINGKYSTGEDFEYDPKTSFHAGINVELHLASAFLFNQVCCSAKKELKEIMIYLPTRK